MMRAPTGNTLQPLPANVQPSISQSVQRTPTQTDVQTVQSAQVASQQNASVEQNPVSASQYASYVSPAASPLWILLAVLAIVIGAAVWLWRSF